MMRSMRAIAPWIMLVVAVTFVGWMVFEVGMDIQGQTSGGVTDEVASVNGRKIEYQTFLTAVRNTQELQRQQGVPAPVTIEEQRELEDAVMEQLVQEVLLEQEYRRRDITVSDDEVRDALLNAPLPEVQQIPEFQTEGQFDLAKYQRYLRSGADPGFALALEARYRQEIPRLKLYDRLTTDVYVSEAKLWRIYKDQHDSATAEVVAIVPQVVTPEGTLEISEDEITRYYREHRTDFERPGQAFLSFTALPRRPEASDSAASLERAQQVRQEIVEGADFGEVARRVSADSVSAERGGDLGEVALGTFVSEFEEAALRLRPGQISEPVLSQFGYHIIRLEERRDTLIHASHVLIPIELHGEHLDRVDRKADSLDLFAAEVEDPTVLDTIAAAVGLPVVQAPPLYQGNRLQLGRFVIPDVHIWAFEAQEGYTSPIIETDWAYYVFRLDSLRPAAVPPLEDVRDQVRREVLLERQWAEARALATRIEQAITDGLDLPQVADSFGLRMQRAGPFTRLNPGPALQGAPEAIGAAFGGTIGRPSGPYETEFALFFVEPVRWTFSDREQFQEEREELHSRLIQQARQAKLQLVLQALREQAEVEDRRRELERALQQQQQQQQQGQQMPGGPLGF
jgi:peptidyl-prolyl cis-trans isomerase D